MVKYIKLKPKYTIFLCVYHHNKDKNYYYIIGGWGTSDHNTFYLIQDMVIDLSDVIEEGLVKTDEDIKAMIDEITDDLTY
jgi:hypothetical protein